MLIHHYKLLIVLFMLVFAVSAVVAVFEAWMDTRKRPKEAMFWCPRHGPIRKVHCLPMFPGMTMRDGSPFLVCPHCVQESWNTAEGKK